MMLESGDVREMTEDARRALTQSIDDQAAQGRRILAFAHKVGLTAGSITGCTQILDCGIPLASGSQEVKVQSSYTLIKATAQLRTQRSGPASWRTPDHQKLEIEACEELGSDALPMRRHLWGRWHIMTAPSTQSTPSLVKPEAHCTSYQSLTLGSDLMHSAAAQTSLGPLANYDGPSHAEHARLVEPENYAGIESGMVFLGMAALEDPPRPEVRDAIEECTLAGIRVSSCPNNVPFRTSLVEVFGALNAAPWSHVPAWPEPAFLRHHCGLLS